MGAFSQGRKGVASQTAAAPPCSSLKPLFPSRGAGISPQACQVLLAQTKQLAFLRQLGIAWLEIFSITTSLPEAGPWHRKSLPERSEHGKVISSRQQVIAVSSGRTRAFWSLNNGQHVPARRMVLRLSEQKPHLDS